MLDLGRPGRRAGVHGPAPVPDGRAERHPIADYVDLLDGLRAPGRLRRVPAHLRRGAAAARVGGRRAPRPLRDRADPRLPRRGQAGARHLPRHPDPQRGLRRHALPGHRHPGAGLGRRIATGTSTTTTATRSTWSTDRAWPSSIRRRRPGHGQQRPPPGGEGPRRRVRGRGPLARPTASSRPCAGPATGFVAAVQWHPEFTAPGDADQIPAEPVVDDFLPRPLVGTSVAGSQAP